MKNLNVVSLNFKAPIAYLACLLSVGLLMSPVRVSAIEDPPGCSLGNGGRGNESAGGINPQPNIAHLGDTVSLPTTEGMTPGACKAINATGSIYVATGKLSDIFVNITLDPGVLIGCPAGAASSNCVAGANSLVITAPLVGAGVGLPNGTFLSGVPKSVRAVSYCVGTVLTGPEEQLQDSHTATINIVTPCIQVFKTCDLPLGQNCFIAEMPVRFRGYVTNCGDITLTNVTVIDSRAGQMQLIDPVNGSVLTGNVILSPGAYAVFSNSFNPTLQETCAGSAASMVTATAKDTTVIGGPRASVTNSYTDVCLICFTPAITITKQCPTGLIQPGGLLTYTGSVSNAGNITLTNVTVVNNQPANETPVIGPITLVPGAVFAFTNSYTVPQDSCGPYADTLTVRARTTCGLSLSNTASASCASTNSPSIDVVKACPVGLLQPGQTNVVTGTVTNTGNITLNNVYVTNTIAALQNLSRRVLGPISLAPGAGTSFTDSYVIPLDSCGPYADTFAASGADKCFGRVVTDSDTKACPGTNSPSIDVVKACPVGLLQPGQTNVVTGTVTNTGNITLNNVYVTNTIAALQNLSRRVLGPISLAPGAGTSFTDSYVIPLDSCGPYADTFAASGADKCFGRVVTDSDTKACPGTNSPSIDVVKACPVGLLQPGQTNVVTGTVTNTGNITLNNVVVTNTIAALGNVSRRVFGPISLAPGAGATFSDRYVIPLDSCGPYADTFAASGADKCFGRVVTDSDTKACQSTNSPRIFITKYCPAVPVAPNQITTISGMVSNTGNITLTNVLVFDDQPANNTLVLGPISLAPGQFVFFTNSYLLPANCCTYVDTVSTSGRDKCFGRTVTNSATAVCTTTTTPMLTVTKTCPPLPVPLGQPLVFSGVVSNAGNITLTNVTVVNSQPTANTLVLGPIDLAPGEIRNFTGSYLVPIDICETNITDTVTARGNSLCNGNNVSASQSESCPIVARPRLVVTKNCPANPVPPGGLLSFSGIVSNAGNITLTNVFVVNDHPTNNTPVLGPVTLAPNQFLQFSGSYTVCPECCPPYVDTISAWGTQICNGSNVVASATAHCPGISTPELRFTVDCPPAPALLGQFLFYSGTVINSGDITLGSVLISDNKTGFLTQIDWLAPGQTAEFYSPGYLATNCGPNVVTLVTASAYDVCTSLPYRAQISASCVIDCKPTEPLVLLDPQVADQQFKFSFATEQGRTYIVQYTESLVPPVNWQSAPSFIGDGSIVTISNARTNPRRFYRVLAQ